MWGVVDPNTGADCSGFSQYVYAHFGVSLPRTAAEQAYCGKRIPVEEAQPGDLIFKMDETGNIYHVVIYAGNGRTIEAKGRAYGIGSFDLNYTNTCWAARIIDDVPDFSSTTV